VDERCGFVKKELNVEPGMAGAKTRHLNLKI
jgi:hypothetical protein